MLNWAQRFNIFCFLDSCNYTTSPHRYQCILAAGSASSISSNTHSLEDIDSFIKEGAWTFGHLSYDLKNSIHRLKAAKENKIGFAPFFFFKPQFLLQIKDDEVFIEAENATALFDEIEQQSIKSIQQKPSEISFQSALSQAQYLDVIRQLQQHILRGDCYEINFCQEFFAEKATIDPQAVFQKLMEISPNPFSAFYKMEDQYLLCASPERFVAKENGRLITQPIKGTIKRNLVDSANDQDLKKALFTSAKDRAENVMIVDLMRNDLSRICTEGSVSVDELFGIYSFPQVHQMISTISGTLKKECTFSQIIKALFPMGSMTGAPKQKVMELIDQYEPSSRGIFSGSVGYINPAGDFDFNVVIRSIMYNQSSKYLSYQVGSGITFYSDPQLEWEECNLKAEAIKKVLAF